MTLGLDICLKGKVNVYSLRGARLRALFWKLSHSLCERRYGPFHPDEMRSKPFFTFFPTPIIYVPLLKAVG